MERKELTRREAIERLAVAMFVNADTGRTAEKFSEVRPTVKAFYRKLARAAVEFFEGDDARAATD